MLTTQRRFEPSVVQRLLDEPYRFEYFQSVRLFEIWFKQQDVAREHVVSDILRFKNRVSLAFPASEVEHVGTYPHAEPLSTDEILAAFKTGELAHIEMTPTFMGMLGANGALPAHYTERISEYMQSQREDGPKAFLDLFSNRALALFYEAWRKYRLELKYEKTQQDHFLPLLLSLSGIGQTPLKNRLNDDGEGVLDESIAYFAAAFRHRPVSASLIQQVLNAYFSVPIQIQQFIGAWYQVPTSHQTRLGSETATLGAGAMIGERVWQRDLCMRLEIGPMRKTKFDEFLPAKIAAKSLEKILTMFTGLSIEYEVQLILHRDDVKGVGLHQDDSAARLGWNSFLLTEPAHENRADVKYRIHGQAVTA